MAPEGERNSGVAHRWPTGVTSPWREGFANAYRQPMHLNPRMPRASVKSIASLVIAAAIMGLVCSLPPASGAENREVAPASSSGLNAVERAQEIPPSAVLATTWSGPSGPAAVVGDDQNDLYSGTGSLVIPSRGWQGDSGGRQRAASCVDCSWKITRYCPKADFAAGKCRLIRLGCPTGTMRVRVWLQRPGESWTFVGVTCQGASRPHTVAEVGEVVRGRAVALLPALRAAVQPANGALLGIPAVFRTGQPAAGIRGANLSVLDLAVRLDSRVRWRWSYGDDSAEWSAAPGGPWPDTSVSHRYTRAGMVIAQVRAVWRGRYMVDGLGPFVVPGPALTQDAAIPILVQPARSHLVG